MKIDRVFQLVALMLAAIAVYFWWTGNSDGLYAAAVLGAVAFFISIRFQAKERNRIRQENQEETDFEEESAPPEAEIPLEAPAEKGPTRTA